MFTSHMFDVGPGLDLVAFAFGLEQDLDSYLRIGIRHVLVDSMF